ncbi:MAG: hypothetical protein A3I05_02805 [Deltaproteobacteria bacterium RIFCSPLOWO2_02_FULL_44_10]|nr:MAG: hypothetical protein A3C46_03470 [Deltaproteobacteria bacterium RIFCSPHIGHO2_02_FULL_44_16]OGQ46545.1 MAG: hypothetical protein A3I05_02805 [Deltaproteobacteria bacterium RIFCSPLOWO2_02_FULL_44_10]
MADKVQNTVIIATTLPPRQEPISIEVPNAFTGELQQQPTPEQCLQICQNALAQIKKLRLPNTPPGKLLSLPAFEALSFPEIPVVLTPEDFYECLRGHPQFTQINTSTQANVADTSAQICFGISKVPEPREPDLFPLKDLPIREVHPERKKEGK